MATRPLHKMQSFFSGLGSIQTLELFMTPNFSCAGILQVVRFHAEIIRRGACLHQTSDVQHSGIESQH